MLRKNQVEDLGMICGGDVEVFFQFISASDEKIKEMVKFAIDEFEKRSDIWIITDITGGKEAGIAIYTKEDCRGMEVTDQ